MPQTTRIPRGASLYEVVRTHPQAATRLSSAGLGRDYLDYRIADAARAIGMPVSRLTVLLEVESPESDQ
jgi:hypothetical protein